MGDTPKELQARVDSLAKDEAAMNQRLAAVGEKIGRITRKPTAGDRLKALFLPRKQAPLAKLSTEREQITQALRTNREQRDETAKKLEGLTKKEGPPQPKPEAIKTPTVKQPDVSQVKPSPLRSSLGEDAYAPSLSPEPTTTRRPDPLRSNLGEDAYAPSLQPEPTTTRRPDPLRSNLGSDAYAPSLSPEPTTTRRPDPLRSSLGEDAYAPSLSPEPTTTRRPDPLRSESGSNAYDVIDERPESIAPEPDPLRSELGGDRYDVIDERTGSISPEQDPLRSEEDLAPEAGHEVAPEEQGPQEQIGPQFKMKSMEERYLKGEKEAPSSKVQINGKETTVQQKDWLRDQVNDERRKRGLPEVSKELWEKAGAAGMQANTQYFDEQQRAEHQVTLKDGALKGGDQNLQQGSHIFVMDGEGQLYAKSVDQLTREVDDHGRKANVHHSSFLAGEEVAGAGEIRVGGDGALKEVTDRSGHYKPGEEQTRQTLEAIDQQGVSLDNVQFTLDRGVEDKTQGMAREFLQGQVTPEEQQHRAELQKSGQTVRDTSKAMEETFKGRHNVADQIKAKGASVRDTLKKTDNLKGLETRAEEQGRKQGLGRVK